MEFVTIEDFLGNQIHFVQHTHQTLLKNPCVLCILSMVYSHHQTVGNSNKRPTYPKVCDTIDHNAAFKPFVTIPTNKK